MLTRVSFKLDSLSAILDGKEADARVICSNQELVAVKESYASYFATGTETTCFVAAVNSRLVVYTAAIIVLVQDEQSDSC